MLEMIARGDEEMRVEVSDGAVTAVMDEPEDKGGRHSAPTPMQTLLASLAGCTVVTLKLYAARKQWPLERVDVRVTFEPAAQGSQEPNRFAQHVVLHGDLDEAQRERLMQIAGRCPVHRVLENRNEFSELEAQGVQE